MTDRQETIADIIAEMRGMGNYQRYSGDHARVLAGRIEAAHKRERSNSAALRVAVKDAYDKLLLWNYTDGDTARMALGVMNKLNAALAAPPRNCDVGTADEQAERYGRYCDKFTSGGMHCETCPCCGKIQFGKCEFAWAQMPYVEKEGGAK